MSLPAPGSHPGSGQPAGEPLISALVADRCPACGARLGPAAEWCGLCFADLRPAPAPAAPPAPPVPLAGALPAPREASPQVAAAPLTSPSGELAVTTDAEPSVPSQIARPTWPCSGCGAAVGVELDACPACGTAFLGALRASSLRIELPVVGDLGRFSDRSRVVLGAGAGLAIAFLLVVLTALLGR